MQLIEEIEISYFRSFYKETLAGCQHTNIIFGKNDSGKSNTLRALNLFFNGFTSPGQLFNFERDLNHSRRAEAEVDDGVERRKFIYVKVHFRTPDGWNKSLGKKFWVKKQWSVSFEDEPQLSTSISGNKIYLKKFLKKIKLHYIPAIKDRTIFERLQAEIYKSIASSGEFHNSLEKFSDDLRGRTEELSKKILSDTSIMSALNAPKDLTDLFRSLDFETQSDIGDSYSLTLQRGDGIQVRHIPPILSFLADNSKEDFHIWAFEEPENSLELANAINEAEQFRGYGKSNNKQVFLTSHSPAFFSLEHDDVSRYFVSRRNKIVDRYHSNIEKIENSPKTLPGELMGETPHLPVISSYLREAHEKILQQELTSHELKRQIDQAKTSMLFVEGICDKKIFKKAWEVLIGGEPPFEIISSGGTTKMESLSSDGKILSHLAPDRKIFALVDNDKEGRSLHKGEPDKPQQWQLHKSNGVYWCKLPLGNDFSRIMKELKIDKTHWPGNIENFFNLDIKRKAAQEGALVLDRMVDASLYIAELRKKVTPLVNSTNDEDGHYYIFSTNEDYKEKFANWIVKQADKSPEIFSPLKDIFEGLAKLLAEK